MSPTGTSSYEWISKILDTNDLHIVEVALTERYRPRLVVNPDLSRRLVSFQANKTERGSRWFRYKEGFSVALVGYLFDTLGIASGRILDPFAGTGTTLFVATDRGLDADGIELLPSSSESIKVRSSLYCDDTVAIAAALESFVAGRGWEHPGGHLPFPHIPITLGAFPDETEHQLGRFLYDAERHPSPTVRHLLRFASLCVLEAISYTRKDGQYLRWDRRSGRQSPRSRSFNKGNISPFSDAIASKIAEIVADIRDTTVPERRGTLRILQGTCLDILPTLEDRSYDALVTSPPYCNRYDYTRTYALELALMGVDECTLRSLRQALLSCTVENREKHYLAGQYTTPLYDESQRAWASQDMLSHILIYLERCRATGDLNNTGIPRMVRNYFAELALVIFECARVLRPGAPFVMVNDNVRYSGVSIPVDLILSDIADRAGLTTETIWVLPRGKGNSSQQMGEHGREELRKCVYLWRKR